MFRGDRLKKLREEYNLSQAALGKMLELSATAVNRYENNMRFPKDTTITKLSEFFNVSTDYLLNKSDYKSSPVEKYIRDNIRLIMGNLSIEEFADSIHKKLNFNKPDKESIHSYINGIVTPSRPTLQLFADFAEVDLDFFFDSNNFESLEIARKLYYDKKNVNVQENNDTNLYKIISTGSVDVSIIQRIALIPPEDNKAIMSLINKILDSNIEIKTFENLIDLMISTKKKD